MSSPNSAKGFYKSVYVVLALLTVVGLSVVCAITPIEVDDLWYLFPANESTPRIEAVATVWNNVVSHWYFDTGRLANIVSPIFLALMPKWLYACFFGFCVGVILMAGRKLIDADKGSLRSFLYLLIVLFVLPWHDFMFVTIYSLNYVATSAVVLSALLFILRAVNGQKLSVGTTVGSCLLCLAAGWMHEGFSAPIACGLVVYLILARRCLSTSAKCLIASFFLGLLAIVISPAFWARQDLELHTKCLSLSHFLLSFIAYDGIPIILALTLLAVVMHRRWHHGLLADRSLLSFEAMSLTTAFIASVIFIKYYYGARTGWFPQLISAIAILKLQHLFRFHKIVPLVRFVFVVIAFTSSAIHLISAVYNQNRLSDEHRHIVELLRKSPSGQVFYDNIPMELNASLWKPSYRVFFSSKFWKEFSSYYSPGSKPLCLLPADLESIDLSRAHCSVDSLMLIYNGHLLLPDTIARPALKSVYLLTTDGPLQSGVVPRKFVDSSGRPFTHLRVVARKTHPNLRVLQASAFSPIQAP